MSATTVAVSQAPTWPSAPGQLRRRAPRRKDARPAPSGREGGRTGPAGRPSRAVSPPTLTGTRSTVPKACEAAAAPQARNQASQLRLTDRGIAVILVTGAMIVLAAATVIALTALRVTGDSYQPPSVSHSLNV